MNSKRGSWGTGQLGRAFKYSSFKQQQQLRKLTCWSVYGWRGQVKARKTHFGHEALVQNSTQSDAQNTHKNLGLATTSNVIYNWYVIKKEQCIQRSSKRGGTQFKARASMNRREVLKSGVIWIVVIRKQKIGRMNGRGTGTIEKAQLIYEITR
ncbi:17305_t:CDS:2 [Acaulospora colombiana]|uniref:17305_t:CDS:1 n=1 Tax=Acaulospora colombiana TaxID=27376 RepID=A0ACA9PIX7_9GLOM|nr:17305_t:CDS:2 [Acaulospora colombiana]